MWFMCLKSDLVCRVGVTEVWELFNSFLPEQLVGVVSMFANQNQIKSNQKL